MRTRTSSRCVLLCSLFAAACGTEADEVLPDLRLEGFATPESVLHDPVADVYLVSNIAGAPTGKDGEGWISRVTPDGTIDRQWIRSGKDGVVLNAPKGMAIAGEVLWVADIDVVRRFDRATGAPRGETAIAGATFLNDVAAMHNGEIWVTDSGFTPEFTPSGTAAVHAIAPDGSVRKVLDGEALGQPNGIVATPTGAFVVTWDKGSFAQIDLQGRFTPLLQAPKAQLDGLVRLPDGRFCASSWAGACCYVFDRSGAIETLALDGLEQPADIGYDEGRGRLLVPLFGKNEVWVRRLPPR